MLANEERQVGMVGRKDLRDEKRVRWGEASQGKCKGWVRRGKHGEQKMDRR